MRHHLDQPRQRDCDIDGRLPCQRRTGAEPGGEAQSDRGARRADGGAQVPAKQERRERIERGRLGLKGLLVEGVLRWEWFTSVSACGLIFLLSERQCCICALLRGRRHGHSHEGGACERQNQVLLGGMSLFFDRRHLKKSAPR